MQPPDSPDHVLIPKRHSKDLVVTITSWETTDAQWEASVNNRHDLSYERYKKFKSLINKILVDEVRPTYIVLPECSVPARWAHSAAQKLAQKGISFICGLEYEHSKDKITKKPKMVSDAFLSLTTNWPGYSASVWIKQQKILPAHNEAKLIKAAGGPPLSGANDLDSARAIYVHGDFFFGVLLCSDLTSLENRIHYQGHIDALFVLEWNPDTETFGSLVESTALDLHSYVIQVNNRTYGDSRIRVPRKIDYERDLIRIKGGTNDFFVSAKIDYRALRKYQSATRPPGKPFKPWPIGYKKSPMRK
ncbi:hypothetical protein GCM10008098_06760 [Rhodanobacter panaciterrae]|uniref:CN hydrolase domain-containing protein n=1 Tax=Rhodanobacter panaciterrae TaxID=490572 RepID=A0ABQ2ZMH1_9GAMM|nr:hypothetical protein GCM10008098_06760 [Rhodanobacter panaciterrae]